MSCVIEEIPEPAAPEAADRALGDLLINQCDGDTQRFLTTVFGFLGRKTNWLQGNARQKVLDAFRQATGEPPAPGFKAGFLANAGKSSSPAAGAPPADADKVCGAVHGRRMGLDPSPAHCMPSPP
jgi:hypothetical protein